MKLPHILVIDDQYGDPKQPNTRDNFLFKIKMREVLLNVGEDELFQKNDEIAVASICRGQDESGKNDYAIIKKAIKAGWSNENKQKWALVLLDVMFGDDKEYGEDIRKDILEDFPGLPIVMLTGKSQNELSDHEIPYLSKDGLDDYCITSTILQYGRIDSSQIARLLRLDDQAFSFSQSMFNIFHEAFKASFSKSNILLLGESGVGKEVVANYIHNISPRNQNLLVPINITSIPETLIEAELFGYEKGAFNEAKQTKKGLFEIANGGSLFLDEIGDMPMAIQTKILRALQERKIRRVGGLKNIDIDVRLLSATSKDIPKAIESGNFRNDLYHRVNTVQLIIPPLKERPEDIMPMAEKFLDRFMKENGKKGIVFSNQSKELLKSYNFPGNVRELENLVERFVIIKFNNQIITSSDVSPFVKLVEKQNIYSSNTSKSKSLDVAEIKTEENLTEIQGIRADGAKLKIEYLERSNKLLEKALIETSKKSYQTGEIACLRPAEAIAAFLGLEKISTSNAKRYIKEILAPILKPTDIARQSLSAHGLDALQNYVKSRPILVNFYKYACDEKGYSLNEINDRLRKEK